jgi:hypothetical protein
MKGDAVAIKTAARTDPTAYILRKGVIEGKWSYAELDEAADALANPGNGKPR